MLTESQIPASFWGHAITALVHVQNRSPTAALSGDIPYTRIYGKKPNVSHLRVFGCTGYVHIKKDKCKGLSSHTEKCVFIGYPAEYKAWTFYNPLTKNTIISNTAEFDERAFPGLSKSLPPPSPPPRFEAPEPSFVELEPRRSPRHVPELVGELPNQVGEDVPAPMLEPVVTPSPHPTPSDSSLLPPRHYPAREHCPPQEWWKLPSTSHNYNKEPSLNDSAEESLHAEAEWNSYLEVPEAFECVFKVGAHSNDPKTLAEAMARPDGDQWYKAAYEEIQALLNNGTWKLAKLPPGRKAIGSRWVFLLKHKKDGSIDRYKGRLVAKGYSQRPGFDFTDTFAPTAKWSALRAILALAALEDLELESIDISSAFLNGDLEEEVYMEQPEGFHQGAYDDFLQLLKGLYGLRQSPRIWHKKLDKVFQEIGFAKVRCDHSIWIYQKDDVKIIIPVFVDDMTLASKSKEAIQRVKAELKARFKLRDLGPTTFLLGVGVERDRTNHILHLSQRQYIIDLLERYNHADCSPVGTPMDPGTKLTIEQAPSTPEEIEQMKTVPYIHAVGSLMYLAVATRPDIAYAVGVLARFNSNPGKAHWNAVKHLFRYLKGTLDYKLTYGPSSSTTTEMFQTYSDADHGGDKDSGRSTGAYVVKLGTGAISWSSKLQTIVTLSTTEAEYIAAVTAGQEILWLWNLFSELGYQTKNASTLYIDNQSAVSVAKNPEHHGHIKHLDLHFYWL